VCGGPHFSARRDRQRREATRALLVVAPADDGYLDGTAAQQIILGWITRRQP
jgi:hypothetical protein